MKKFLGIETTPPLLERLIRAATKFKKELPTDLQMESIPLKDFRPWLKIFILKHGKHRNKLASTCKSFWASTKPYKEYRVSS